MWGHPATTSARPGQYMYSKCSGRFRFRLWCSADIGTSAESTGCVASQAAAAGVQSRRSRLATASARAQRTLKRTSKRKLRLKRRRRRRAQAQAQLMAAAAQGATRGTTGRLPLPTARIEYSANALHHLGSTRSEDIAHGGVGGAADIGGRWCRRSSASHTGRWPLLLFHDGSGAVSGA